MADAKGADGNDDDVMCVVRSYRMGERRSTARRDVDY